MTSEVNSVSDAKVNNMKIKKENKNRNKNDRKRATHEKGFKRMIKMEMKNENKRERQIRENLIKTEACKKCKDG